MVSAIQHWQHSLSQRTQGWQLIPAGQHHPACEFLPKVQTVHIQSRFRLNRQQFFFSCQVQNLIQKYWGIFKSHKATSDDTRGTDRQGREANRDRYTSPRSYTLDRSLLQSHPHAKCTQIQSLSKIQWLSDIWMCVHWKPVLQYLSGPVDNTPYSLHGRASQGAPTLEEPFCPTYAANFLKQTATFCRYSATLWLQQLLEKDTSQTSRPQALSAAASSPWDSQPGVNCWHLLL